MPRLINIDFNPFTLIYQYVLYAFPMVLTTRKLCKNRGLLERVLISCILVTLTVDFSGDNVWWN